MKRPKPTKPTTTLPPLRNIHPACHRQRDCETSHHEGASQSAPERQEKRRRPPLTTLRPCAPPAPRRRGCAESAECCSAATIAAAARCGRFLARWLSGPLHFGTALFLGWVITGATDSWPCSWCTRPDGSSGGGTDGPDSPYVTASAARLPHGGHIQFKGASTSACRNGGARTHTVRGALRRLTLRPGLTARHTVAVARLFGRERVVMA